MHNMRLPVILVVILFVLSACNGYEAPAAPLGTSVVNGPYLRINIDTSGSVLTDPLRIAVENIFTQLPLIAESLRVRQLSWSFWASDGWMVTEKFSIELPSPLPPTVENAKPSSEFTGLKNFEDAHRKKKVEDSIAVANKAQIEYRTKLLQLLRGKREFVLAALKSQCNSPCSDINGVLLHASQGNQGGKYIEIDVTDAAENCTNKIRPAPDPGKDVTLIIVLVPESDKMRGASAVAQKRAWEQFTIRQREIEKAVPWAKVVPFDHRNLLDVISKAQEK